MDRSVLVQQIADNIHWLKRETQGHLSHTFASLNVSPAQIELLKLVREQQPVSHKELAAQARLTPGAVSQLLDGLEQSGSITRTESPTDRRVSLVSLSHEGEHTLHKAKELFMRTFMNAFDSLDDDELLAYQRAQQKLIAWHEANCTKPTNQE